MKALKAAIMAIALLFATAFSAFAQTAPSQAAVVQMIVEETNNTVKTSDIERLVHATFLQSEKKNLDPFLVIAAMGVESHYRPWAKNKSGARGLLQVIPRYHRDKIRGRNIMNIETNVDVGTDVMVECLDRNQGLMQRKTAKCYSGNARNYLAKLKAIYKRIQQADIVYRFKNQLPLTITCKFEEPRKFSSISENPVSTLAPQREQPQAVFSEIKIDPFVATTV